MSVFAEPHKKASKTEVLHGIENSLSIGLKFMQNAKTIDVVADKTGPSILIENNFYKMNLVAARNRGAKLRYLADITKDNLQYCREMMRIANEMRHFEGFTGGLAVSDSEYMGTPSLREKQHSMFLIYSNESEIVEQQQLVFNTLWEKAIPAKQRIKEIELGTKREFVQTIREPAEIHSLLLNLLDSAERDILLLVSTTNTFQKIEKLGIVSMLVRAAAAGAQPNLDVRVIVPENAQIKKATEKHGNGDGHINFRILAKSNRPSIIILIVDESISLVIDIKDDSQEIFEDSLGMGTCTNVESTVETYISIFEKEWFKK